RLLDAPGEPPGGGSCPASPPADSPWSLPFRASSQGPKLAPHCLAQWMKVPTVMPRGFFLQYASFFRSSPSESAPGTVLAYLTKISSACGAPERATDVSSRYQLSLSPNSSSLLFFAISSSPWSRAASLCSPDKRSHQ